jgi:hypothetical protein
MASSGFDWCRTNHGVIKIELQWRTLRDSRVRNVSKPSWVAGALADVARSQRLPNVACISDYLPAQVSRSADYEPNFERKLGIRPEFVAVASYTQYLAHCAGTVAEERA